MRSVDLAINLMLWACASGFLVLVLSLTFDFLVPRHQEDLENGRCDQERGKAIVVAALTGVGLYLAQVMAG